MIDFIKTFGEYALNQGEAWRLANPEIMDAYQAVTDPAPKTRSGPELRAGFEKDLTRIIDEWEERREVCLADPEAKARFLILRSFELVTAAEEGR